MVGLLAKASAVFLKYFWSIHQRRFGTVLMDLNDDCLDLLLDFLDFVDLQNVSKVNRRLYSLAQVKCHKKEFSILNNSIDRCRKLVQMQEHGKQITNLRLHAKDLSMPECFQLLEKYCSSSKLERLELTQCDLNFMAEDIIRLLESFPNLVELIIFSAKLDPLRILQREADSMFQYRLVHLRFKEKKFREWHYLETPKIERGVLLIRSIEDIIAMNTSYQRGARFDYLELDEWNWIDQIDCGPLEQLRTLIIQLDSDTKTEAILRAKQLRSTKLTILLRIEETITDVIIRNSALLQALPNLDSLQLVADEIPTITLMKELAKFKSIREFLLFGTWQKMANTQIDYLAEHLVNLKVLTLIDGVDRDDGDFDIFASITQKRLTKFIRKSPSIECIQIIIESGKAKIFTVQFHKELSNIWSRRQLNRSLRINVQMNSYRKCLVDSHVQILILRKWSLNINGQIKPGPTFTFHPFV